MAYQQGNVTNMDTDSLSESPGTYDPTTESAIQTSMEPSTVYELAKEYLVYRIGIGMEYVILFSVVVGIPSNCLACIVMAMKHNRSNSCYRYMLALSSFDTVELFLLLVLSPRLLHIIDISLETTPTSCGVIAFLNAWAQLSCSYLVVAMTIDRMVAVTFPLKVHTWCTTSRSNIATAVISLASALFAVPSLFVTYRVINHEGHSTCFTPDNAKHALFYVYSACLTSIRSIIPFVALLCMNSIIIRTLHKRNKWIRHGNANITMGPMLPKCTQESHLDQEGPPLLIESNVDMENLSLNRAQRQREQHLSRFKRRDNQLVVMLLLVSFTLLVLTMPQSVRLFVYSHVDMMASPQDYAIFIFVAYFTYVLVSFNYAINLYLYCIAGRRFRNDLKSLCSCWC